MEKKIIRLTEADLTKLVKRVMSSIVEQSTPTGNYKIDPNVAKSKGFTVVKDNNKIIVPSMTKNNGSWIAVGSVNANDYDYVLLSKDGNTYACRGNGCHSYNKQTGKIVDYGNGTIKVAQVNVGLSATTTVFNPPK